MHVLPAHLAARCDVDTLTRFATRHRLTGVVRSVPDGWGVLHLPVTEHGRLVSTGDLVDLAGACAALSGDAVPALAVTESGAGFLARHPGAAQPVDPSGVQALIPSWGAWSGLPDATRTGGPAATGPAFGLVARHEPVGLRAAATAIRKPLTWVERDGWTVLAAQHRPDATAADVWPLVGEIASSRHTVGYALVGTQGPADHAGLSLLIVDGSRYVGGVLWDPGQRLVGAHLLDDHPLGSAALDTVRLTSFDPRRLMAVRDARPDFRTAVELRRVFDAQGWSPDRIVGRLAELLHWPDPDLLVGIAAQRAHVHDLADAQVSEPASGLLASWLARRTNGR